MIYYPVCYYQILVGYLRIVSGDQWVVSLVTGSGVPAMDMEGRVRPLSTVGADRGPSLIGMPALYPLWMAPALSQPARAGALLVIRATGPVS
jgi:hypothetical protein